MTWNIASAKQQFSEVVRLTAHEPQAIYNRDKPVAVMVSAQEFEEFRQWKAAKARPSNAELFAEIRAILAQAGRYDIAWIEKPDLIGLFNLAMRVGAPMQGLMFRSTGAPQGTVCAPMLNFMLGDRHMRPLAKKPLHVRHGALDERRQSGGIKVAFYPGCMGDKMYVDMAEACLKVLHHHNVAVFMPKGLTCCGIPALSSGDADGMVKQMKVNLKALDGVDFDYILSPCGSCTSTIKELWPRYADRIGAAEKRKVDQLAAKAMDINAFLVDVLKVQPAAAPAGNATTVTYHDSCHLKKSLGVVSQPRAVMAANPAYKVVEMAEPDRCCGCGGSFNLFHYDYSRKIGQRKRDNVVASRAEVVAAGCPACMMQLEDVLSHNKDRVRVMHTVEIYAESLK